MISKSPAPPGEALEVSHDIRPLPGQGRMSWSGAQHPAGPFGLTAVQLPPGYRVPRWLSSSPVLGHVQAVMLGWLAGHQGATRDDAIAATRRRSGYQAAAAAYDRLVTLRLITESRVHVRNLPSLTLRGQAARHRVSLDATLAEADLVAANTAWNHPINGAQRWILVSYIGLQLLGWSYPEDGPDELHAVAAWDAMTRAAAVFLRDASLPLTLTLWNLAACGPVPLTRAAEVMTGYAAACDLSAWTRETRRAVITLRKSAGVGLTQVGADPWAPDDSPDRELIGPAAGWTLDPPAPAPGPALHVVEG